MHLTKSIVFCLVLVPGVHSVQAGPYSEYEDEITGILSQRVPEREIIRLATTGQEFIALYREPEETANVRGAAIIAPPMGAHADWPEVITPLRIRLPETGWATLSLQMPLLPPGSPLSEYGETVLEAGNRLTAAVRYLRQKQFINVIFIGYGFGAAIGADFLANNPGHNIDAFIGISMQSHDFLNPRLKLLSDLEVIDIPILDLYAGNDRSKVLGQIDDRRLAGRKNGRRVYDQIMIVDADRFYTGFENVIIDHIKDWLEKNITDILVKDPADRITNNIFLTGENDNE